MAEPVCTCPTFPDGTPLLDGCAAATGPTLLGPPDSFPESCAHNGGCPVREAARRDGPPPGCCRRPLPPDPLD